ncbi:MAG: ATP-binding protein [Saprospiraceae bacterium]|nr:ATP-binding protein [Saprospiraceae bacterium]
MVFDSYTDGVIIDEAQKVPNLFSYMQGIVDKKRTPGRFVLSGSQNYLLHRNITQSLAGRIDLSTLYPLDFEEMGQIDSWDNHLEKTIINGFYPGKLTDGIPGKMFYSNYIKTYLERDVSDLVNVGNITTFRTFLKLVAYKCGSQLKMTDLSNDLNVSVNTIKAWITILESSYIIFMLPSYHKNLGKRLLKTPKLYFFDTGLLCHLLGLNDEEKLKSSDKFGIIFENLVIAEKVKYKAHRHLDPDMFFFRDSNGLEVDLFEINDINKVAMTELKSGKTFKSEFLTNMKKLKDIDPSLSMNLVYNGDENIKLTELDFKNWRSLHS